MPYATNANARIYYETMGDRAAPALLLIGGFSAQISGWETGFCRLLVERGFQVIRFDNRDVGLSTQFDGTGGNEPGYTVHDMAGDGLAVLDALVLRHAHVVGQSMGGMIAQAMASAHPERVTSLTLVYTAPSITVGFLPPLADVPQMDLGPRSRQKFIDEMIVGSRKHSSSTYPIDEAWVRTVAEQGYDRAYTPEGVARQLRAMLADLGEPFADAARLTMPVVLIHGLDDTQVHVSGSLELARRLPHAEVHLYAGMRHYFPEPLWRECCDIVTRTARRADLEAAGARLAHALESHLP